MVHIFKASQVKLILFLTQTMKDTGGPKSIPYATEWVLYFTDRHNSRSPLLPSNRLVYSDQNKWTRFVLMICIHI